MAPAKTECLPEPLGTSNLGSDKSQNISPALSRVVLILPDSTLPCAVPPVHKLCVCPTFGNSKTAASATPAIRVVCANIFIVLGFSMQNLEQGALPAPALTTPAVAHLVAPCKKYFCRFFYRLKNQSFSEITSQFLPESGYYLRRKRHGKNGFYRCPFRKNLRFFIRNQWPGAKRGCLPAYARRGKQRKSNTAGSAVLVPVTFPAPDYLYEPAQKHHFPEPCRQPEIRH